MDTRDDYESGTLSGGASRRRYAGAANDDGVTDVLPVNALPSGRPPFRRTPQPGLRPSPGAADGDGGARLARTGSTGTLRKATQDDSAEAEALLTAADGNGQKAGEALIAAIRDGKTGVVHELLAAGVPVKTRARSDGSTALHAACARGATHTAAMLLARDASLSATDGAGWAPVHTAAFHGHANVLLKLLEAGADAGAIELQHNKTALHWCVRPAQPASQPARCRDRVAQGIRVYFASLSNSRPFYPLRAALNGHHECASLLLAAGGEADAMNHEGTTPLHEAAFNGHAPLVKLLLDSGASADGTPPLASEFVLASKSLSAAVRLNCGGLFGRCSVQPTASGLRAEEAAARRRGAAGGATPLHWAVRRAAVEGSVEAVGMLLNAGASVDAADTAGETPLHKAAANGDAEVCERLLEAGAALEARSRVGDTPLRRAAAAGQVVTSMVLLAAGADANEAVDAATGDAAALLGHVRSWCDEAATKRPAAQQGWLAESRCLQKAAVRVMVMRKAALDGHMSEEACAEAAQAATDAVVAEAQLRAMLAEARAGTLDPAAALEAAPAAVAQLPKATAAAMRRTFPALFPAINGATAAGSASVLLEGVTPLHMAAARGDGEALLTLLGAGADADVRDGQGRTPLHSAAAAGSAQACKILLAGGASLRARYTASNVEYSPAERISVLVYGTAAAFGGGTPLDVAVGDALPVLQAAAAKEAARRGLPSSTRKSEPSPSRRSPARSPARQPNIRSSPAAASPAAPSPRAVDTDALALSLEAAEAKALETAEAAALALEAEMDAEAMARERPCAAHTAAAGAAARRAHAAAAAAAAALAAVEAARAKAADAGVKLSPRGGARGRW
jgi:ankyrin repeat protein